jgi:hypothetical protein
MKRRHALAALFLLILPLTPATAAPPAEQPIKPRLADRPPMGWNSWAAFHKDIDQESLKAQVDALVALSFRDAGYNYFVIDGGWKTSQRDAGGNLEVDAKKFPNGMKAFADYVHAHGLKFGLHQPAGIHDCGKDEPGSQNFEERDATLFASWGLDFIKYDQCDYIHDFKRVAGAPDLDKLVVRRGKDEVFAVEAEAPWNHVTGLARVEERSRASGGRCVAGIGYDGGAVEFPGVRVPEAGRYTLEVGYCLPYFGQNRDRFKQMTCYVRVNGGERQRIDAPYEIPKRYTTGSTSIDVDLKAGDNTIVIDNPLSQEEDVRLSYVKMAGALKATGRDVMFSTSGAPRPWLWGEPIAHLFRTSGDLADRWPGVLSEVDRQAAELHWAGPGFWADPDCLMVGLGRPHQVGRQRLGMTEAEDQAQFSLWSIMNAPLFISADLRHVDDTTKRILLNHDVIDVNQDALAIPGRIIRDEREVQVFAKRVVNGVAVAILNRSDKDADVRVTTAELGLGSGAIESKNLWTGEQQKVETSFTSHVGTHAVTMFRLSDR